MPARTIFVPPLKQESAAPKGRNKDPAAQGCAETEGAKFSLKEEATAIRAPPVQNGGCYKQPFAKRPISCLHAAALTKRAGVCLLGHSCSCKNRQSITCPARPGTSWVLCSKMSGEGWPPQLWLGAETQNHCLTGHTARQTARTISSVQQGTGKTGQT